MASDPLPIEQRSKDQRLWIPVAERMPEFWQPVLGTLIPYSGNTEVLPPFVYAVTCENVQDKRWIYTGTGGLGKDGGYSPVSGYVVTHWMPYPEPANVK